MGKKMGPAALPRSHPLPSSLQIEFVTGTKKGTTTNATATTTTTASTAVAGRRRLVCFQLRHRWSEGSLPCLGEQTLWGLGDPRGDLGLDFPLP